MSDLFGLTHLLAQEYKFGRFTVFLFESPKASELGGPNREADLLKAACELSGHRFAGFAPVDKASLMEHLQYVFETWELAEKDKNKPQFSLHFSCHGNEDGVQIGKDFLEWTELSQLIGLAQGDHSLPFIISLSACGGGKLKFANMGARATRPLYIFSFTSAVSWPDAALTWALLYRKITAVKVGDRDAVQEMVNDIQRLDLGELRYHRWDGKKFKVYAGAGSGSAT